MNNHWLERTELLIKQQGITTLQNAHILIAGLGGVGSYAAEFVTRAGVGALTIVDADTVSLSNINRQLPALHSTIGQAKTEVMRARLLDINPELKLTVIHEFLTPERAWEIVTPNFDYVIDCIDSITPKLNLILAAKRKHIKLVSCMGATGATGKDLVTQLLTDDTYSEVHCFVRKPLALSHPKLHAHEVNFDTPEAWADLLHGDVAFSCLGTTLAVAGSKEAQWRVDYDYQYAFAQQCKANGVPTFVLVSAAMANAQSKMFYNRMKGQLEDAVKALGFSRLLIFQPSVLVRKGSDRKGEQLGLKMIVLLNKIGLFKRYRPMPTAVLAQRMRKEVATANKGIHTFTLDKIF